MSQSFTKVNEGQPRREEIQRCKKILAQIYFELKANDSNKKEEKTGFKVGLRLCCASPQPTGSGETPSATH
ncbi:hypothetical protein TNCV_1746921 [Trichonephila clavipes]|nr:hypothetical protein TNCV_1746921 [Trichonephila clavipes]